MGVASESAVVVPRVLLPVGTTTDVRPRIEWKWNGPAAQWQVRVRAAREPGFVAWEKTGLPGDVRVVVPGADMPSHETLLVEVRLDDGNGWQPWGIASIFSVEPVSPLRNGGIVLYDLHYTRELNPMQAFAHAHLVSALQGLVNRPEPRLYVRFVHGHPELSKRLPGGVDDIDSFWLKRMRAPEGWLDECTVRTIDSLTDLLEHFSYAYDGVVLWDTAVPATSNVASTIAGADNLLPIPCCNELASLHRQLVAGGPRLPVKVDLRGLFSGRGPIPGTGLSSSGSAKCDAYLWAIHHYLESGKCDPTRLPFYIDAWWAKKPGAGGDLQNYTLTNHDYFIAHRGFFWDLDVWPGEAPVDDPQQKPGTDATTLHRLLAAANRATGGRQLIHVGGFTPWAFKYTSFGQAGGGHEPVATEWETAKVLSAYNAYLDADALGLGALANASFLQHFPLPRRYAQVLPYTPAELKAEGLLDDDGKPAARNFLLNYVGDYDSAAWAWNSLALAWEAPARGRVPMAWAVNPNLALRVPPLFEHIYRTRTANDVFMAGDSGAGYVNPTMLTGAERPSGLPDAGEMWASHCGAWYGRFGLKFTGFVINGAAGPMTAEAERLYRDFSPDGIINQQPTPGLPVPHLADDLVPAFVMEADLDELEAAVKEIRKRESPVGAAERKPNFRAFRQILKEPGWYAALHRALNPPGEPAHWVFCDPHTFGCLARANLGGDNRRQAALVLDALPRRGYAGEIMRGEIAMRNDGWEVWEPGRYGLALAMLVQGGGDRIWGTNIPVEEAVPPGGTALFPVEIPMPDYPAKYTVEMDMEVEGVRFCRRAHCLASLKIRVVEHGLQLA